MTYKLTKKQGIKVLSEKAINKIAAGEVIERPVTIVKELVENSIDAKSDSINIIFRKGGRTLISVQDNGIGIDPDEMAIAFCKHATSKLSDEDLDNIQFFGFRGEALCAISSVSKTSMISKKRLTAPAPYLPQEEINQNTLNIIKNNHIHKEHENHQETTINSSSQHNHNNNEDLLAWQIKVEGGIGYNDFKSGNLPQIVPANRDFGTTIEVTDLFYFTPNKLRFLRSEQSENTACIDLIQRLALSFFNVNFRLQINDKEIINYTAYHNSQSNKQKEQKQHISNNNTQILNHTNIQDQNSDPALKHRITEILGQDFISNAITIDYLDDEVKIHGYASLPTHSKFTSSRQKQYCYVNGRIVKDRFLTAIIKAVYSGVIPNDRYPTIILFIEVNPALVDVNIHPNKTQIKFWHENKIKSAIFSAIRKNLAKPQISSMIKDELIKNAKSKIQINRLQTDNIRERIFDHDELSKFDYEKTLEVNEDIKEKFRNFQHNIEKNQKTDKYQDNLSLYLENHNNQNSISNLQQNTQAIQQHQKQNTATNQGLDISKIKLGNAICQINKMYILSETDNGIVIVDQHAAHERLVLENIKAKIKENRTILKQSLLIPQIIEAEKSLISSLCNIQTSLKNIGILIDQNGLNQVIVREVPAIIGGIDIEALLIDIANDTNDMYQNILANKINEIYSTIACYSSIRAGRKMNIYEMNALLRGIENTEFASQCNHGRPTYIELDYKDIGKIFERC